MAAAIWFFSHNAAGRYGGGRRMLLPSKIRGVLSKVAMHTSLWLHESHRIFICCGMGIVVLVFIVFTAHDSMPYKVNYYSAEILALRMYLEELSGPLTQEKADYIESERTRVRQLSDDWSKAQKSALVTLSGRVAYLEENEGAFFLYDEPHNILTAYNGHNTDLLHAAVCMIIISLMMPCLFAPDLQSGMNKITNVTRNGKRKLVRMRYTMGVICAVVMAVLLHLAYFMQVLVSYGVKPEVFTYPVNSIPHLFGLGDGMSIGIYYLSIYLGKVLFAVLGAIFVIGLSRLVKSQAYTTFAGIMLLVAPALAVMYDMRAEGIVYPLSAMLGNMFLQNRTAAVWCVAAVVTVGVTMKLLIRVRAKR